MAIDAHHPLYDHYAPEWVKIDRVVRGEKVDKYLMELNPLDKSKENEARNKAYKDRAVFYDLSGNTVAGFIGTMYGKKPSVQLPDSLEYLTENADGSGMGLEQHSKALAYDVITRGRAGLAVSFPQVDGQVSRAQMQSGEVVATINRYSPEQIINWRTTSIGAKTYLSLVVLYEVTERPSESDKYTLEEVEKIREMYLDVDMEGNLTSPIVYHERLWEKTTGDWSVVAEFTPTQSNGETWPYIPFTFVGSEDNNDEIDKPPMKGIVDLNIAHYRNSADYEDSVFYAGQAQAWMSGITQDHIDMMKANGMYVGSRQLIAVPDGGSFGYSQAGENPAVRQAMIDKVEQMASLGARMVEQGSASKTATQAAGEQEVQHSVISLISENITNAYKMALKWVGMYMGVDDDDMQYMLNSDFVSYVAQPQELQFMVQAFQQGAMPMQDYVMWMKKRGYFRDDVSFEEYAELLSANNLLETGI